MAETVIGQEATGVFQGVLLEDMIDTVKKTKKLYCDVDIPQFYEKTLAHPLTYVPIWAMSLPLKKGDKVWVKFHQDNLTLPVLWKLDADFDTSFYDKYEIPNGVDGGNASKPETEDVFWAQKFGDNSYIIKTKDYTIIHQDDGYACIDKDGKVYTRGTEINIVSVGKTNIDSSDNINLFTSSGKIKIGNNVAALGDLLSKITDYMDSLNQALSSLHTEGSPASHTATSWWATVGTGLTTKASDLKTTSEQVLLGN